MGHLGPCVAVKYVSCFSGSTCKAVAQRGGVCLEDTLPLTVKLLACSMLHCAPMSASLANLPHQGRP